MPYYPLFLKLEGRPCLVVGGGTVAERKVQGLLEAKARVKVVSPEATEALRTLAQEGRMELQSRPFQEDDAEGTFLAVVATDDKATNRTIAQHLRAHGVLVNAVDDPEACDFICPAVVRRGDVVIAVSTSGSSPALARRLREGLEAYLTDEYPLLAGLLSEVRQRLKEEGLTVSAGAWQQALRLGLSGLVKQGFQEEAKARLLSYLLQHAVSKVKKEGER